MDIVTTGSIIEGDKEVKTMTTNTDREEMYANVTQLQELLHSISSDVRHSYDVLVKDSSNEDGHGDDVRYTLSLGYLSMSHQSYLEFKRIYHQNGLEHYEIDPFLKQYEHYKVQLKEVITAKDSNTSWLVSALDQFTKAKQSVDEFLSEFIKNAIATRK